MSIGQRSDLAVREQIGGGDGSLWLGRAGRQLVRPIKSGVITVWRLHGSTHGLSGSTGCIMERRQPNFSGIHQWALAGSSGPCSGLAVGAVGAVGAKSPPRRRGWSRQMIRAASAQAVHVRPSTSKAAETTDQTPKLREVSIYAS